MSNIIRLAPGQYADSAKLVHESALAGCTRISSDDAGVFFERRWPSLSSGEEVLWSVLSWLNGVGECPSGADLAAQLDPANLMVASAARASGLGVTA